MSVCPNALKSAIVNNLLKKPNLDVEQMSNYRLVSHLSYIFKLIEKVVASQIVKHIGYK